MKTKAIITLSEDDYYRLVYLLGYGDRLALKAQEHDHAKGFQNLYHKILNTVTFAEDHEKPKR